MTFHLLSGWYSDYFNSHPRVGGDPSGNSQYAADQISIRTPAWGVTRALAVGFKLIGISIRTPAWGVTSTVLPWLRGSAYFNSHPRVGGDDADKLEVISYKISIRTPAWGVTCAEDEPYHLRCNFNSYPRVGGDSERRPHSRWRFISIRPPAWGVTGRCGYTIELNNISIRTPAWGVTAKIHKTVFNHLYIFAALCAFCSEITQQKAIIIRILKENTSIHCADLPENYARLRSAQAGLTEAAAHRFRSDRCGQLPRFGFDSCSPGDRCGWNPFPCK